MVYGNFDSKEVKEDKNLQTNWNLRHTKVFRRAFLVKAYNHIFDIPYTIIRPSALYGERCVSRRVGQIFIEKCNSKS